MGTAERLMPEPYLSAPRSSSGTEAMSPVLDPIAWRFADWTRSSRLRALDVGCGDGLAAAAAVNRGAHVLAVDPNDDALRHLLSRVPAEQQVRLQLQVARLPHLDFESPQFCALHAGRVLHLLEPTSLQLTLQKFHRWVYPDGRLFISAFSPEGRAWEPARPDYEARAARGDAWPGFIRDLRRHFPHWSDAAAPIHLLDERTLTRELELHGFTIEEVRQYPLPWDSELTCCGVVARRAP